MKDHLERVEEEAGRWVDNLSGLTDLANAAGQFAAIAGNKKETAGGTAVFNRGNNITIFRFVKM